MTTTSVKRFSAGATNRASSSANTGAAWSLRGIVDLLVKTFILAHSIPETGRVTAKDMARIRRKLIAL